MPYDHSSIEPKWQARWRDAGLHKTPTDPQKPKFYVLDMFPYPSGAGLHVGHCEGYTATDVITRCEADAGVSTCCTRWAGTPSACRPRTTPSSTASTRA